MPSSDTESSSNSSPATPQRNSIAKDITQILRNQKYGKGSDTKNKKKKKGTTVRSMPEDSEEQTENDILLEPLLAVARWIPLAIDPFISLRDVFIAGINGRSGRRETMNKEEQYQCIVFELIVPLIPNFISILSEVHKDTQAFENLVFTLGRAAGGAKSSDAHSFKTFMYKYIAPDEKSKPQYIIPDASKKTMWGWHNTVTARYLCPMRLVSKFNENPDLFREEVQTGRRVIKASSYPMFLYDESKYNPNDLSSGLFQGHLLVKFYRHVFTSPSSWDDGSRSGGKQARGIANGLRAPTPRTIAYVAVMLRWALSSLTKFEEKDQDFCLIEFYRTILSTFNERMHLGDVCEVDEDGEEWVDRTLHWWQGEVPALKRGIVHQNNQNPDEESDLSRLRASRKMRAEANNILIDPRLQTQTCTEDFQLDTSAPTGAAMSFSDFSQPVLGIPASATKSVPHSASAGTTAMSPTSPSAPLPATTAMPISGSEVLGPQIPTQLSAGATARAPITDVSNTQDSNHRTDTLGPASDTTHAAEASASKQGDKRSAAANPLVDDTAFGGDLTPHASPVPKRPKPAPVKTAENNVKPRAVRKSTRRKF